VRSNTAAIWLAAFGSKQWDGYNDLGKNQEACEISGKHDPDYRFANLALASEHTGDRMMATSMRDSWD
jgi:hypothetical protein